MLTLLVMSPRSGARLRVTNQGVTDAPAFATGGLQMPGNAANGETVTLDTKVYVFETVLTDVDGHVLIGATTSDSIDNLIAAIILGPGVGVAYATSTTKHPTMVASPGFGDTMVVQAIAAGLAGNLLATTETLSNGSFVAPTLTGGTDGVIYAFDWVTRPLSIQEDADIYATWQRFGLELRHSGAVDLLVTPIVDSIELVAQQFALTLADPGAERRVEVSGRFFAWGIKCACRVQSNTLPALFNVDGAWFEGAPQPKYHIT